MKPLKSTLTVTLILLATAISGTAFAHHRDWHHSGPPQSRSYSAPPRTSADVQFGFSVGGPVWYEPAPGYYYAPAQPYYYYEPAQPYYYYDSSPSYYYYYDSNPTIPPSAD